MPKFLLGTIVVRTYEVFADTLTDAQKFVLSWQESDTEAPESGIKVTRHKLTWEENQFEDVVGPRDKVLEAFLHLMHVGIPGMPTEPPKPVESRIIHPFTRTERPEL